MSIDKTIIQETKDSFRKEFGPQIEELGLYLSTGIKPTKDSYMLLARIQNISGAPPEKEAQAKEIIPETYKGIPVEVGYLGRIIAE
ncbi:MAG: hypothetical protein KC535_01670 [Nanoarchaeota archaeon]|nr:hypothetical protein [Nanoarchaeota archaeon]